MSRTGHAFPRDRSASSLRTERVVLQLTAHRSIAIDGAGAGGSTKGAGGVAPGPSKDHGGDGACLEKVVVATAPPRPSARDKNAVRHRVVNQRRLPMPPKIK